MILEVILIGIIFAIAYLLIKLRLKKRKEYFRLRFMRNKQDKEWYEKFKQASREYYRKVVKNDPEKYQACLDRNKIWYEKLRNNPIMKSARNRRQRELYALHKQQPQEAGQ